jgi:uncharacterized glyoxalase superfamily protein PhnB
MPATATRTQLQWIAPQFRVPDVVAAAEWYRDRLGFSIGEYFHPEGHDAPAFVIVWRDGIEVQLGRSGDGGAHPVRGHSRIGFDAYVMCAGVRELYEELVARGAEIDEGPAVTNYGLTEFAVRDCFGYTIAFAEEE